MFGVGVRGHPCPSRTPGVVARVYRTYIIFGYGNECRIYKTHKKFRVRECMLQGTHISSGYGMGVLSNSQEIRVGIRMLHPYPWYGGTGVHRSFGYGCERKKLAEVPPRDRIPAAAALGNRL